MFASVIQNVNEMKYEGTIAQVCPTNCNKCRICDRGKGWNS